MGGIETWHHSRELKNRRTWNGMDRTAQHSIAHQGDLSAVCWLEAIWKFGLGAYDEFLFLALHFSFVWNFTKREDEGERRKNMSFERAVSCI